VRISGHTDNLSLVFGSEKPHSRIMLRCALGVAKT
jgi:hypothetical protein